MADVERWRIVEQFTIYQIALLISGYDPSNFEDYSFDSWNVDVRRKTIPILKALEHAVEDSTLPLRKIVSYGGSKESGINFESSLVHVSELRTWLAVKGIRQGFFTAPITARVSEIENAGGRYFAPKLAAANAAWRAVTSEPHRLRGKSPKQALVLWLTEHAAQFGLVNKDGSPNVTGIDEVAKVANWQLAGGAPTTQVDEKPDLGFGKTLGRVTANQGEGFSASSLDDDIPF